MFSIKIYIFMLNIIFEDLWMLGCVFYTLITFRHI